MREEGRPQQPGIHPRLHVEAVAQLRHAVVDPSEIRERERLEAAAPLDFLRQSVFAADSDHLVAEERRFGRLAAQQVDVLGERRPRRRC